MKKPTRAALQKMSVDELIDYKVRLKAEYRKEVERVQPIYFEKVNAERTADLLRSVGLEGRVLTPAPAELKAEAH